VSPFNNLNVWELVIQHDKVIHRAFAIIHHMGVSLNGGTPKPPQNDHFWSENPMALLGKTHHFRNHPHATRGIQRHNLKMLGHIRLLHFDGVSCHKFMVETEASGQISQIQEIQQNMPKINTPVN